MATWFDEARLDDPGVLETVDLRLRTLAESGARVRREAHEAATEMEGRVASLLGPDVRVISHLEPRSAEDRQELWEIR